MRPHRATPTRRTAPLACAALALLLALPLLARAELRPAHYKMRSQRAQANREQIFRHLTTGATPSWMRGKSRRQINAWSKRMKKAILRNGRKVVRDIVARPDASPSKREQRVLGLLSPMQRAKLLREEAGFKVDSVRYKVNGRKTPKLKIRLQRLDHRGYGRSPSFDKQMSIYNRVMSPNLITYMPAGGHSKYVSRGKVTDLYFNSNYGDLRPQTKKRPMFPTWLSDMEAMRMKQVFVAGNTSWKTSMGTKMSHGRPGMWPPTKTQRKATGNSCTTAFNRAPVGERDARYAWIDKLQAKVQKKARGGQVSVQGVDLKKAKLLEAITGKDKAGYEAVFSALKRQLPGDASKLNKLKGEVDFLFGKLGGSSGWGSRARTVCTFPMDLMHRVPLAKMANIKGDPVGPGMGKQKFYGGDPTRLGVVTVFDK